MTPDASGWRSEEDYARIEALMASDLAWEWLRRNDVYDRDFGTLKVATDPQPLMAGFRQKWGLRFPR